MSATLFAAFLKQVRSRPDAVALIAREQVDSGGLVRLTWAELAQRVAACLMALQARQSPGTPQPACAAYLHRNRIEDVCIALAAMGAGWVEVPIDARREPAEVQDLRSRVAGHWLEESFCAEALSQYRSALEAESTVRRFLTSRRESLDADAPSLVIWTTGTTGAPKGVTLSQRNLFGNASAKLGAVPQTPSDVRLTTLPLSHAYARTCDFGTWLISGSVLALTLGYRGWESLAELAQPTHANVVPALAAKLLESPCAGQRRLRVLGCGGAPLTEDRFARFRDRGVAVIQGYGLTEASPVIASATEADACPGSVGRPVSGWEIEIRHRRLYVRGPHVMLGYWNDREATAQKIDAGGWLDTGDLVEREEATGELRILGRADDLIVLPNGSKLHPRRLEALVEEIPDVAHAMVRLAGDELELWFDGPAANASSPLRAQISQRLATLPVWMQPKQIHQFTPPLSLGLGELTIKGTLRRSAVEKQRFQNQAGS